MGTCKDCKYWTRNEQPERGYGEHPLFGNCGHPKLASNQEADGFEPDMRLPADNIIIFDDMGISAPLETGENFGCIHFEAGKPAK